MCVKSLALNVTFEWAFCFYSKTCLFITDYFRTNDYESHVSTDPFKEIKELIGDLRVNEIEQTLENLSGIPDKISFLEDALSRLQKAVLIDSLIATDAYAAAELRIKIDELLDKYEKLRRHATSPLLVDSLRLTKLFNELVAEGFAHSIQNDPRILWMQDATDLAFLFHCLAETTPPIAKIVTKSDYATLVEQHIIFSKKRSRASLERNWNDESTKPGGHGLPYGVSTSKKVQLRERLKKIVDGIP